MAALLVISKLGENYCYDVLSDVQCAIETQPARTPATLTFIGRIGATVPFAIYECGSVRDGALCIASFVNGGLDRKETLTDADDREIGKLVAWNNT